MAWGWGQLALGSRRGWLLATLEVCWLVAIVLSLALLETDKWLLIYCLLAGFLLVWIGQAVAAQRAAARRSGRTGGAVRLVAVVPVMIVVLSGFWLFGGRTSSATATFHNYVSAWENDDIDGAKGLFMTPRDTSSLTATWKDDAQTVAEAVDNLADAEPEWELDAEHPYTNLRFAFHDGDPPPGADRVTLDIQIVRLASVPSTFFGLFPSTRSETQVVATLGQATLVRVPAGVWLPLGSASIWLIESVTLSG